MFEKATYHVGVHFYFDLYEACQEGKIIQVTEMLTTQESFYSLDVLHACLCDAAKYGHLDIIDMLIKFCQEQQKKRYGSSGSNNNNTEFTNRRIIFLRQTILHNALYWCCHGGQTQLIKPLLCRGINCINLGLKGAQEGGQILTLDELLQVKGHYISASAEHMMSSACIVGDWYQFTKGGMIPKDVNTINYFLYQACRGWCLVHVPNNLPNLPNLSRHRRRHHIYIIRALLYLLKTYAPGTTPLAYYLYVQSRFYTPDHHIPYVLDLINPPKPYSFDPFSFHKQKWFIKRMQRRLQLKLCLRFVFPNAIIRLAIRPFVGFV